MFYLCDFLRKQNVLFHVSVDQALESIELHNLDHPDKKIQISFHEIKEKYKNSMQNVRGNITTASMEPYWMNDAIKEFGSDWSLSKVSIVLD